MSERPKISVDGVDFEWDREKGRILVWGHPSLLMWIETTLAGLMVGIHKMVGTERFVIAAEQAGRASIDGEVAAIMQRRDSVEDGFKFLGISAAAVGHGHWELVQLERDKKEARFRVHNSWEGLYQKALGVNWGASTMAGKFGAHCTRIFETYCRAEQTAFIARGDAYDEFIVRPSERTLDDDLDALIGTEKATNADLTGAFERLQREVEERRRIEEDLRREVDERRLIEEELRSKLDLIRRQEEAIRAMSTPILRLWEGVLTMPVIGLVDSTRAGAMMEALLEEITRTQARFTILDLTGVDIIDTGAASHLLNLVQAARLLGTQCLVSGISPSMASTVVSLDLDLGALKTFGTLEAALRYAIKQGQIEDREAPKGGKRGARSAPQSRGPLTRQPPSDD